MALGLTGSRKARVSGLLKNEFTIFDTCCKPSLDDMVLAADNAAKQYRAILRYPQHREAHSTHIESSAAGATNQHKHAAQSSGHHHVHKTQNATHPNHCVLSRPPSAPRCAAALDKRPLFVSRNRMVFAGQDAWRKHPMIANCYKRPFPGFGIALGLFAGYCVLDGTIKFATGVFSATCSSTRTYSAGRTQLSSVSLMRFGLGRLRVRPLPRVGYGCGFAHCKERVVVTRSCVFSTPK